MRDEGFISSHRGGPLDKNRHCLLSIWAADCAEHVLPLFSDERPCDDRPRLAIDTARAWSRGEVTVGEARAAASEAHTAARDVSSDAARDAARAAGHAVATAHMADHALQAAVYAILAVRSSAGGRGDETAAVSERMWQRGRLPVEIRSLMGPVDGRKSDCR